MKKTVISLLTFLVSMTLVTLAWAEGTATKDECVAMCKKVVQDAKDKGIDAVIKMAADPKGPYVWKNSYVFIFNYETNKVVAHPEKPMLVNKDLSNIKDIKGKMFFIEFCNIVKEKGSGWVDYMWPKPDEKTPVPKSTYLLKIPNQPYAAGAGFYH